MLKAARALGLWCLRRDRHGHVLEPIAGAFHGGGKPGSLGLVADRLHLLQRADASLHATHHGCRLGAALTGLVRIGAGVAGGQHGVLGVEVGGDKLHRELGLGSVLRKIVGDGNHGAVFAPGPVFGGVRTGLRQVAAKIGVDGAGEMIRDIGDRVQSQFVLSLAGEKAVSGSYP